MTILQRLLFLTLVVCAWSMSDRGRPAAALACFAIVAGRAATADGSVLVGHNEQDLPPCIISFDRVPRRPIEKAIPAKYRYRREGEPLKETAAYLWSQCVPKEFADSFLNEYGVTIVSNRCPSLEDSVEVLTERGEIRDGGIGLLLRRLVAQQATTAREGALIAGDLVERFGYRGTGRTYVIADPKEAWLMSIVCGRHWVAQRVPDDAVVVLPNVYVVRRVDLSDKANFLGSVDLVEYAVKRGWYDREKDGVFDFRRAYRDPKPTPVPRPGESMEEAKARVERGRGPGIDPDDPDPPDPRRWWAHGLVTGRETAWPPKSPLPLCITPKEPVTVARMAEMLRSRGGIRPLSTDLTVETAVVQLRADLPRAIGCVYWRITCEPAMGGMAPWYLGVESVPENYHAPVELSRRLTTEYQFDPPEGTLKPDKSLAWWKFKAVQDAVNEDFEGRLGRVRAAWARLESRLLAEHAEVDRRAAKLWKQDEGSARRFLTEYCAKAAGDACVVADRLLEDLEREGKDSRGTENAEGLTR
jgi:dipeptidase